jgi:hypothetical protein
MQTTSVIKKIEKAFGKKMVSNDNVFTATIDGVVVEAHDQENDCLFIVVRRENDVNDSMTDYCAGGMYYTIKGAINRINYIREGK